MSRTSIACIAFEKGKIFIAHRIPVGQMGGRWEFPGGKVEAGENDQEAIVRELQEEFGVTVSVGEKITESSFMHNGESVALHVWFVTLPHDGIEKPFTLTEHTEYKWVNPDEIHSLDFVDSDLLICPRVIEFCERKGQA